MKRTLALVLFFAALLVSGSASAAPPWVDRTITLPRHDFAFDAGLGLGHVHIGNRDFFGPGFNLEGAFGITEELQLGFRTGIRAGTDGEALQADNFGRTLFLDTYGTGGDAIANPELSIRYAIYQGRVVEVALDGRLYLPVETGTRFGMMFGVPLAFHIGNTVRIDTGAYMPLLFYDRTVAIFSVPGYFWFQTSERLWLGPIAELRANINASQTNLLLGFGLGYQVSNAVDLKTWFLLPAINQDNGAQYFGAGFGVQVRVE